MYNFFCNFSNMHCLPTKKIAKQTKTINKELTWKVIEWKCEWRVKCSAKQVMKGASIVRVWNYEWFE